MILLSAALAATLTAAPLTLDDALLEAARANPDLRIARSARASAQADFIGARSGVLPRLDLTAQLGRDFVGERSSVEVVPAIDPATGLPTGGFDRRAVTTPARDTGDYQLGLRLTQSIFDGLSSWRRIEAARAGERAADRQLDETSLAVAFEVTSRFYAVVKQDESVRVLEETVRRSEDVLQRAEALFVAGRTPKSDVIAARVNLENDRISAEAQRASAAQARADLAQTLGRDRVEPLDVTPPAALAGPPSPGAEPAAADALLARARDRRALLAARREQVTQGERSVDATRGAYWPALSAQASYSRVGPELGGSEGVYGNPTRQYVATAALVLSWNLYAGGETTANKLKAAAAAEQARAQLSQAEQQVTAEIARARVSVVSLGRSIVLAQAALVAAEEGEAAARARLEAGAASQLEVRDAELKLTQARLALLSARVDEIVSRADLARATGGQLP